MAEGTDPELLHRLRRGDQDAFDAVYDAHKDQLYRFLVRMTGRPDLAQDLFQETWMRFAQHAPGLRDDTSVRAWLFTVARNLAHSHGRRAVLDARAVEAIGRWWYLAARPPAPDDAAAGNATLARLEAAFAALAAPQRQVLSLVAVEGLPHDEAARILGLTPEATRQRLSRARAELVRRLDAPAPRTWRKTWRRTLSSKA